MTKKDEFLKLNKELDTYTYIRDKMGLDYSETLSLIASNDIISEKALVVAHAIENISALTMLVLGELKNGNS